MTSHALHEVDSMQLHLQAVCIPLRLCTFPSELLHRTAKQRLLSTSA